MALDHAPAAATPTDVMPARTMECPNCGLVDRVSAFRLFITSRENLPIVRCECPVCSRAWRRIHVAALQ